MTLKEKFKEEKIYINAYDFKLAKESAEIFEQIADEFAIGFAEWSSANYVKLHKVWVAHYIDQRNKDNWKTTKELLEIYKKEKGL